MKIDVYANKSVLLRINTDVLIVFMARALLKSDIQQIEHCHGVYLIQARTIKTRVIDGFKTTKDSLGRYYIKFYRKDRQIDLENKMQPTLRMEIV